MPGQPLVRGKDREHGGLHARDLLQELRRLRAALAILEGLQAEGIKKERLPAVVLGEMTLIVGKVLKIRQMLGVGHERVELGAHLPPVGLDLGHPGEVAVIEKGAVANLGLVRIPLVEAPDDLLADLYAPFAQPFPPRSRHQLSSRIYARLSRAGRGCKRVCAAQASARRRRKAGRRATLPCGQPPGTRTK